MFKKIYLYLILLIIVSSFIIPCFSLDTDDLPEGVGECINNSNINNTYKEALSNANYYILIREDFTTNRSGYDLYFSSVPIECYLHVNMYKVSSFKFKPSSSDSNIYKINLSSSDGFSFTTSSSRCSMAENGNSLSISSDISFIQCNYDLFDSKTGDVYYTVPTILQVATEGIGWNGVMKEVVIVLPIVLIVVVGLIGIRKGIRFLKSNLIKS